MDNTRTSLPDLAASPRPDIVPGHVISPPTFREHAVAEDVFARWYMVRIDRGTRGLNEKLREAVLKAAREDVRDGWFSMNMRGYDSAALSAKGTRLMVGLSLRVAHRDLPLSEACRIYDALEPGRKAEATAAVLQMWGYRRDARTRAVEDARPVEWRTVIDLLCAPLEAGGRGMDFEEALGLTVGQAMFLLGGPATAGGRTIGQNEIEAKARDKQHELFDRICRKQNIDRRMFVRLPLDAILAYVQQEIGRDKVVPISVLESAVKSYAEAPRPA